jgi:hypothetical protein
MSSGRERDEIEIKVVLQVDLKSNAPDEGAFFGELMKRCLRGKRGIWKC